MKLKNMWKRFWTLDVHNHEGFTLVELIIVIAILAILSTGAIAGYSAYVESANITTDKALIAEIENVLTMAYYSGSISQTDSGSIILTTDGVKNASEISANIVQALKDAYGDGWTTALKLKYNGWNLSVAANSTLMGYVHSSKQFGVDGIDDLLGTVEHITVQFSDWLKDGNLAPSGALADYLESAGINYKNDSQAASNATVMFVGSMISDCDLTEQEFADAWVNGRFSQITDDIVGQKAVEYAFTLAMAKFIERKAGMTDSPYSTRLSTAVGEDLLNAMAEVQTALENDPNAGQYASEYLTFTADGHVAPSCEAYTDAISFYAYMSGMTSVSDSLLQSPDIYSNTFFGSDGFVKNTVLDYLDLSENLKDLGITNGVVIHITGGVVTHMGEIKD